MKQESENVSVLLPFDTIPNLRDLGSMTAFDQEKMVKPGLLFRSSCLHHASDENLETLNNMNLENVVDLRTPVERDVMPDRLIRTWNLYELPVLKEKAAAEAFGGTGKMLVSAVKTMDSTIEDLYRQMIVNPEAIETWKAFFRVLLHSDEGRGTLFHCSEGKDRTGMAAGLLLHALDVPEEAIEQDYLQTNIDAAGLIDHDENMASSITERHALLREDLTDFLTAKKGYYNAAQNAVKEGWGSWKGYLKEAVGLTDEDFSALQNRYLMNA